MINNRSMPKSTVIPVLHYPDVIEAVNWLRMAFGFKLRLQMGDHRAQLHAADGAIIIAKAEAVGQRTTFSIMVRIESCDQFFVRVVEQGAKIAAAPETFPYGERQFTVADFAGNLWTFSQSIEDVDPESWGGVVGEL